MQYPDGKGNVYRFGKSHKYAGLYWFNSYNRYQVYRGYYLDTGTIYTNTNLRIYDFSQICIRFLFHQDTALHNAFSFFSLLL